MAVGELGHDAQDKVARSAIQLLTMPSYTYFQNITEGIFKQTAENPKRGWSHPADVRMVLVLSGPGFGL